MMNEGNMKLRYEMSEDSDAMVDMEADNEQLENTRSLTKSMKNKRRSYVWNYFNPVPDHSDVYRCQICNETFGNKTANLGRHLQTVHGVNDVQPDDAVKKGRPNRSIVWNFCTKLDHKRALCHLCKKVLYFGGGNTSNITKHLKRMHAEKIEEVTYHMPRSLQFGADPASAFRRERKGSSYVWNYCDKLSKNTVLCKLCNRRMRFHGTANVITHLQRRHDIMDETTVVKVESSDNVQDVATSSTSNEQGLPSTRRSIIGSVVWKYITRLSEDTVRCRVCLKNLSYQGTSNLQRHLHRMHNIIWHLQDASQMGVKLESQDADMESSFFSFCEATSESGVWKCQMCAEQFEDNEHMEDTISRHMIKIHGAAMRCEYDDDYAVVEQERDELGTLYSAVISEDSNSGGDSGERAEPLEILAPISDEALYNDIIEVEDDLNDVEEIGADLYESAAGEKSPSLQSGENAYSDLSNQSNDAQLVTTTIQSDDTPLMRELKEDVLRQQAMYFSEKAGFYRMQKFLVAQQVRKERLEFEKLKELVNTTTTN
ncbi:uncharacterized protein LOC117574345 [Drosophila albomicans]|uniref:Uncharacterized protein LOC117574345 n=1 Tax=Drosophila albomicans TaxID=7291 RepID=A0A6P8XM79_DROAB|nr:uncharacterized protein LOC117574345 [Drosophila albomicans]